MSEAEQNRQAPRDDYAGGWKAAMEAAAKDCDQWGVSIVQPPRDGWTKEAVEEVANSVAPALAAHFRDRVDEVQE